MKKKRVISQSSGWMQQVYQALSNQCCVEKRIFHKQTFKMIGTSPCRTIWMLFLYG